MLARKESMRLLAEYGQEAGWTKHCFAVAEAAARVGDVMAKNRPIDCSFLWSAALLLEEIIGESVERIVACQSVIPRAPIPVRSLAGTGEPTIGTAKGFMANG